MSDKIIEHKENLASTLHRKVMVAFEPIDPTLLEKLKDQEPWIQKQTAGKVYIRPPHDDRGMTLSLMTRDSELYGLFNVVAGSVTRKWYGFHQIGAEEENGLTGWELWKKPEISDEEILKELKDDMLKEASRRIRRS